MKWQLKEAARNQVEHNAELRLSIAIICGVSDSTVRRWAKANDPVLTMRTVCNQITIHTGIKEPLEQIETNSPTYLHE